MHVVFIFDVRADDRLCRRFGDDDNVGEGKRNEKKSLYWAEHHSNDWIFLIHCFFFFFIWCPLLGTAFVYIRYAPDFHVFFLSCVCAYFFLNSIKWLMNMHMLLSSHPVDVTIKRSTQFTLYFFAASYNTQTRQIAAANAERIWCELKGKHIWIINAITWGEKNVIS